MKRSKKIVEARMKSGSRWPGRLFRTFIIFIVLAITVNGIAFLFLRVPLRPPVAFSGSAIYNPYAGSGEIWLKTAYHLHSDRILYTPERPSPREIFEVFRRHGYDQIIVTDYALLTDVSEFTGYRLNAFEWGANLFKRHLVVIGSKSIFPDFFPFFWSDENLQWVTNQFRNDGAFIVAAHPEKYNALSSNTLTNLEGIDAVEILSPHAPAIDAGEIYAMAGGRSVPEVARQVIRSSGNLALFDALLSSGRKVHAISSVDLHYFPPGELEKQRQSWLKRILHSYMEYHGILGTPFTNYLLINASHGGDETLDALKKGRYLSLKQFLGSQPPQIVFCGMRNGRVELTFHEKADYIGFVGKNGRTLQSFAHVSSASIPYPGQEPYVRIEALANYSIILSNAFIKESGL